MKVTQAQLDALYTVYQRWQDKTPHAIMPQEYEVIADYDYRNGDYIGVWVGGDIPISRDPTGAMYLGIEKDGYTHS